MRSPVPQVSVAASATSSATIYYFWEMVADTALTAPFIKAWNQNAKYPQVTFLKLEITQNAANYQMYKDFNAAFKTGGETTPSLS